MKPQRKFFSLLTNLERFLLYISDLNHENQCWIWEGSKAHNGYGRFRITGGKRIPAHRYAYELFIGQIPKGKLVCHICDNPPCVNPDHLWVGTTKDNMRDMCRKGRSYFQTHSKVIKHPKGTAHPRAKLNEEKVLEIRNLSKNGMTNRSIAIKFNINESTVSGIKLCREWKHK